MKVFNKIASYFVAGIVFLIAVYLLAQSFFTDVRIGQGEIKFFTSSNKFIMLAGFGIFFGIFYLWHIYIKLSDETIKKIIIVISVINIFFIFISQNIPRADQQRVLEYATEIWQGNYEAFESGNYLDIYPNQNGIVLFCYLLCLIGGGRNFLLFQMVNALAVSAFYFFFYWYWRRYQKDKRFDEIILGLILFFPISLYVNYVYGILIGLVLAVSAILCQQIYLQNQSKKAFILSMIFIALAYCMKSNYIIFAAGILLVYFMDFIINKKSWSITGIIGILFGILLFEGMVNKGLGFITEGKSTGVQGVPYVSFIVLGLRNENGSYGWHNGYVEKVYYQNNNDYVKAKNASIRDLKEEIRRKTANPRETIDFFQKKITSCWCEASFGAFYNNRIDYQTVLQKHSSVYDDIFSYSGRWQRILYLFLEIFQNMVYFGIILYLIFFIKECSISKMIGLIIFLGGFIFHLFWEAKSSYALMYFILLIPYAVVGLGKCFDNIHDTFTGYASHRDRLIFIRKIGWIGACLVFAAVSSKLAIGEDNEKWDAYLAEHRYIEDGYYYLKSLGADWLYKYGKNSKFHLCLDMSDTWQYEIQDMAGESRIVAVEDELCMLPNSETDFPSDAYWKWRIQRLNGGFCIRWWNDMNKVITFDEKNLKIFLSDYEEGNLNQIWELKRYVDLNL